jgi:PAS domain S-box-containing protein
MKDAGKRKSALLREVQQLRKQVQELRDGQQAAWRAECALAQYWSLLDAMLSDPVDLFALKGLDYRYQAANQAFCRLVGRSEPEIRGRGDFELFPHRLAEILHRDDIRVIQSAASTSYETRVVLSGRSQWLRVRKRPVSGADGRCAGILTLINDITPLARFRDQLQILTQLPGTGYWCTDVHGYILDVNHTYCTLTGYGRDELLGKNLHEIEMVNTPEALSLANQQVMRDGTGAFRTLHRSKVNRIVEFEVNVVYVNEHGGRFFRFFRPTPDTALVTTDAPPIEAQPESAPVVAVAHRKVLNLNDVLLLAIDQEIDQIPPGILIRKKLDNTLRNTVANQAQILQVIINIVTNAVEAMEGRGHLTFTTRNVELTREWLSGNPDLQPGHYVYLAVADTGRGINPPLIGKIFDPFITTKFKGRGMGLASVRRNVAEHQGLVTVKSDVGKGTTFTVYLPATDAPADSGRTAPQIPAGTETILIVDPESRVLEEARKILERLAYTVILTTTLEEAIHHVTTASPPIDVVVVDTEASMAYRGDFMQALRTPHPSVKVILAGAHELNTWAQDVLDAGANGFIRKPFRPEVLAPKIRQTLDS